MITGHYQNISGLFKDLAPEQVLVLRSSFLARSSSPSLPPSSSASERSAPANGIAPSSMLKASLCPQVASSLRSVRVVATFGGACAPRSASTDETYVVDSAVAHVSLDGQCTAPSLPDSPCAWSRPQVRPEHRAQPPRRAPLASPPARPGFRPGPSAAACKKSFFARASGVAP
jgi:hypothetical protein